MVLRLKRLYNAFLLLILSVYCNAQIGISKFPIIQDTLPIADSTLWVSKMQSASNLSYTFGYIQTDSLSFSKINRISFFNKRFNKLSSYQNSQVKVLVDTSQQISIHKPGISEIQANLFGIKAYNDFLLKSWAVFIYNPSEDTLAIYTEFGMAFMIQEALNENGEWQPIEYWLSAYLGIDSTTNPDIYGYSLIPPKYALIQKTPVYNGDFKTKLRFKLKFNDQIIYSNSFQGFINKNQFNLPSGTFDIKNFGASENGKKLFLED